MERRRKRRATMRRIIVIAIAAGVAVGVYALASSGSKKNNNAASKSTTTTAAKTTTTAPTTTAAPSASTTVASTAYTTSADCPTSFTGHLTKPSWSKAPAMTIDASKTYTATVTTDVGTFTIALDAKTAPTAVNNFVFLADNHFYDCVTFHRVIPGFMDQGGDPTGTGEGGPGYEFTAQGPATASPQYPIGSVAMANSSSGTTDPSTNGSQFFIVTGSEGESLPPDYVLFGQVTSGLSVVDKINSDGSANGVPPDVLHRMISVTVAAS
jgi:cyclophilin family peptidyl-prolyl cis-trans isomerase